MEGIFPSKLRETSPEPRAMSSSSSSGTGWGRAELRRVSLKEGLGWGEEGPEGGGKWGFQG